MRQLAPVLVLFVVLAVLVGIKEYGRPTARPIAEEADLRPLAAEPFKPEHVASVEVAGPGKTEPEYSLVREGKSWFVTRPFRAPAAGTKVEALLKALAGGQGEFRADDRAALAEFHLTPEKAVTVTAKDAAGKELVRIGLGKSSQGRGAFVRILSGGKEDDRAYSVSANLRSMLGLSWSSAGDMEPQKPEAKFFHATEFPQGDVTKAKRAEITVPGRRVVFEKVEKEWKVVEGGPGETLKKDGPEQAVTQLGGAFRPSGLADPARREELGLAAPPYRFAVTMEDGTTRAVVAAADEKRERFYVRLDAQQDPDVVFEATQWEFERLFPTGSALFDLPKMEAPENGPMRVVIEKAGGPVIEMSREGTKPTDDWKLASPAWPLEARQSSLRSLGSQLTNIRPTDYVDAKELGEVQAVVKFGAGGDAPLQELRIGGKAPWGKDRLVVLPGKPDKVFVVADFAVDRLVPDPLTLFEPKLLQGWKRDDVTAARLEGRFSVEREGTDWSLVPAAGAAEGGEKRKAAAKEVEGWIDKLLALEAKEVAAAPPDGGTRITLERKAGDPAVLIFSPGEGGKGTIRAGDAAFGVNGAEGLVPDAATLEEKKP